VVPDLNSKSSIPAPGGAPHVPVLLNEVLEALALAPTGSLSNGTYIDSTLGAGGHAEAMLERLGPDGKLLGVDQDPHALQLAQARLAPFGERFQAVQGNFSELPALLPSSAWPITGGILADIGVSSMQLDQAARGFSFSKEAPLDMRMAPGTALTAQEIVNTYAEAELVRIFSEYGEEHLSKTLARAIVEHRNTHPFQTTTQLSDFIANIYRSRGKQEKIHPATRVFQALRIEVNDELGHLQRFLENLPTLLAPGARVAIISFHSLEDRLIKQYFQAESKDCICPPRLPVCQCGHKAAFKLLTRKPIEAGTDEIKRNPRSRSAKLRAAIRL
jgi:16S rRNA (cytosine1402-N4)-methyltransferase